MWSSAMRFAHGLDHVNTRKNEGKIIPNQQKKEKTKEPRATKTLENDPKMDPKTTQNRPQNRSKMGSNRDLNISPLFYPFFPPFFSRLGPNLEPTWGPKFYFFFQDPLQEASRRPPGAFLKGVKKRLQHRRQLSSIFHRFLNHFRSPRGGQNEVPVEARIEFSYFCLS